MRVFSVVEREFVIVVSCLEIILCHADVSVCVSGCCCDSGFVDDVICEAFTIERAKVLISAAASLLGTVWEPVRKAAEREYHKDLQKGR